MPWMVISLLALLGVGSVGGASGDHCDGLLSYYPAWLVEEAKRLNPGAALTKTVDCMEADLEGSGSADYVVATFGNAHGNALVVFRLHRGELEKVAETDASVLRGRSAPPELRDLDGDGRPEIIVSAPSNRGAATWLFKWTCEMLVNIGPGETRPDTLARTTELSEPYLVDFFGDRRVALLDERIRPEGSTAPMYVVKGNATEVAAKVLEYNWFIRATGEPRSRSVKFVADSPGTSYNVRVVNGVHGKNMADSAEIVLNGSPLVSRSQFSERVRLIDRPATLAAENEMVVTVYGRPGDEVHVFVWKASE
jgi:hypothetical protein